MTFSLPPQADMAILAPTSFLPCFFSSSVGTAGLPFGACSANSSEEHSDRLPLLPSMSETNSVRQVSNHVYPLLPEALFVLKREGHRALSRHGKLLNRGGRYEIALVSP